MYTMCAVSVAGKRKEKLLEAVSLYRRAKSDESLLMVPFITVFDYAHLLREISLLLKYVSSSIFDPP
jgi:hypothetical protein